MMVISHDKKKHPLEIEYNRMKRDDERIQRKIEIGNYLLDHRNYGVRMIAKEFMLGKSTVHQDLHDLRYIDDDLYVQCMNILRKHKSERI